MEEFTSHNELSCRLRRQICTFTGEGCFYGKPSERNEYARYGDGKRRYKSQKPKS